MRHKAIIQKIEGQERSVRDGDVTAMMVGDEVTEYWFDCTPAEAKRWMKDRGIRWKRFKINTEMEKEIRLIDTEFRVSEDRQSVQGSAAVFNRESEDLGGFVEVIEPGAFDNVLADDVRVLKNHNPDWILGRTRAGTAEITQSDGALDYRYNSPDISYAKDLVVSMKRGDITQSSFAFSLNEDGEKWEKRDGRWVRTILKGGVKRLYDVSPVTYPAYPDTKVAARSLEQREKEIEEEENEQQQRIKAEEEAIKREQELQELALSGIN